MVRIPDAHDAIEPARGRDDLLARVIELIRRGGLTADMSLRSIARSVGTSHRMLSYHFGSRDSLLANALIGLRREDQHGLLLTSAGWTRRDAILGVWAHFTAPSNESQTRSFYYVFGLAAQEPAPYAEFLSSMTDWIDVITRLGVADGRSPEQAALEGRVIIATFRGLLMELLGGGDRQQINQALIRMLDLFDEDARSLASLSGLS